MCATLRPFQNCLQIDSSVNINPIRSGLFQTVNDLGGGGALKNKNK